MLMTTQNLPMRNNGIPWGTIILAVIVIGGVSYLGYQAMQSPIIVSNPKNKENERG